VRDLAPVVFLAPSPDVLLVQKSLGINSLAELVALAKSRATHPLTFASVGKGSFHHFSMELFKIGPVSNWSTSPSGSLQRAAVPAAAAGESRHPHGTQFLRSDGRSAFLHVFPEINSAKESDIAPCVRMRGKR
jgi:hypothetical protein